MDKIKPHLPSTLKSSLAFGLGLGLGSVINGILFATADLSGIGQTIPAKFLIAGILLALFITAIGSGMGGAVGGLSLSLPPEKEIGRWGRAWRGALSMGLLFSLVMFVLGLTLSLFSFYSLEETRGSGFALKFGIAGAIFGGLFGLFLGYLMLRKHGVRYVGLASMAGFGLGGLALGECVRLYLLTVKNMNLESGVELWLILGYTLFGLIGGAALGYVFSALAERTFTPGTTKWWQLAIAGGILLVVLIIFRPVLAAAAEMLTPNDANLAFVLDSTTVGTHWSASTHLSEAVALGGVPQEPVMAANEAGQLAQVWSQSGEGIYWLSGMWQGNDAIWQTPVVVSNFSASLPSPQAVVDSSGITHIVWEDEGAIQYSQCQDNECSVPVLLSETPSCATAVSAHTAPALAIDAADTLLAVWQADDNQLLYRTWPAAEQTPSTPVDCVPATGSQPRLDGGSTGHFALAAVDGTAVRAAAFTDGAWADVESVGNGRLPNIYLDEQNEMHIAWCSIANELLYTTQDSEQTIAPHCASRPELAHDSQGTLHIVWYGNEVLDVNGQVQPQNLLYESTITADSWTLPAIISRTEAPVQPSMAATESHLHLSWPTLDADTQDIAQTSFVPYSCDDYPLGSTAQIAYDVARRPEYRPEEDIIPYCQNEYHQLVIMPNPDPAFSDEEPTANGGFDLFAELAQTAEYEILFSTMWYDGDENDNSPGYVLTSAIADLYEKVRTNPEQYPRGMLVRILLGNPPELTIEEFSGQVYYVLADLREAGVDKLIDPEIGWRVEVANFDGAMPHSHTKVMIVDGKTVLAAGFNMQYDHFPVDHPSGKGTGRQDMGMLVSGPVAQNSHRMFDDLWEGSDLRYCSDFYPVYRVWQATCRDSTAVANHVPEVLKYYIPTANSDSAVFSMYRTKDHDEADRIVEESLAAAQNRIDAMHVMFAMEMECDLNLLFDLCDFEQATEYLQGLMQAAENGAHIRLLLKPQPTDGIESAVAYDIFTRELENRGLSYQVEFRFFADPIHYKTTLIDDQFLIVGSQNFHYSAFGQDEGLTEYSLGTDDPQAVTDFQRIFEYQWELAAPEQN